MAFFPWTAPVRNELLTIERFFKEHLNCKSTRNIYVNTILFEWLTFCCFCVVGNYLTIGMISKRKLAFTFLEVPSKRYVFLWRAIIERRDQQQTLSLIAMLGLFCSFPVLSKHNSLDLQKNREKTGKNFVLSSKRQIIQIQGFWVWIHPL